MDRAGAGCCTVTPKPSGHDIFYGGGKKNMADEFMDDLGKAEASEANFWAFEKEGDMIAGQVLSFGSGETEFGEFHFVMLDKFDDKGNPTGEEIQLSFMGSVRANWWERNKGRIKAALDRGDTIKVGCKYLGLAKGAKNEYQNFVLRLKILSDGIPF